MPSLYHLTEDYVALMEIEAEDEVTSALIELVSGEIEQKAENICKLLAIIKSTAETFKAEEQRIANRRKTLENREKAIRRYLKDQMVAAGISKINAGTFSLSIGVSPGALVIDDPQAIPAEFLIITSSPDNAAIKDAIKRGEAVPGCHIESDWTLRVK